MPPFRTKMTASQKKLRWANLSAWAFILFLLLVLLVVSSSPLWYIRDVLYPQTPQAQKAYHSPWVRVPYILLCIAGGIASVLCLPMIGVLLYGCVRLIAGLNTRGDAMATLAYTMLTGLIVGAIMVLVMLPLYVVYRYHISSGDTVDTDVTDHTEDYSNGIYPKGYTH